MMNTSLLQKSGLATLQVAQILAGLEPGDRIPTVTELSEQCEMARGNKMCIRDSLEAVYQKSGRKSTFFARFLKIG